MPILQIEVVGDSGDFPPDFAQSLADRAGTALNSRRQGTWVRVRFLAARNYAENGGAIEGLPVFVSLTQAEVAPGDAMKAQVARLARTVAEVADRPVENVHVVVEPAARGRIAFGGKLIEGDRS